MKLFDYWIKKIKTSRFGPRFHTMMPPRVEIGPASGLEMKILEFTGGKRTKLCVFTTHSAFQALLRAGADLSHEFYAVVKECSHEGVAELARGVEEVGPGCLIAAGGGKCLDTAKLLKQKTGLPLIVIPTSAATCSAFSPVSVVYTPEGEYREVVNLDATPDLVWVDWTLIQSSPTRLLASGMADALAKWLEAKAVLSGLPGTVSREPHPLMDAARPGGLEGPWADKIQTDCEANGQAAFELAREIFTKVMAHGVQAVADHEAMVQSPAWQEAVWASLITSGMASFTGGDDFPAAAAHSLANGLTALPRARGVLHGEAVALGLLVQAILLEGQGADTVERMELVAFFRKAGLPCTLREAGVADLTAQEIQAVADKAMDPGESVQALPFQVKKDDIIRTLREIQ